MELSECLTVDTGPSVLPAPPVAVQIPLELPLAPAVATGSLLCPSSSLKLAALHCD